MEVTNPAHPSLLPNISLPSSTNIITIKLTHTNYLLWKAQVLPYLSALNLFPVVDGTRPCPPPHINGTPNPDFLDWSSKDQLTMAILTSSLTEAVLIRVLDCTHSSEIWRILEDTYAAQSNAQVVQTRIQLASLQKGDDSITTYFNRASQLRSSLAAAGQLLPDSEFIVYVLAGLGPDFESLVTSLSTQIVLPSPAQTLSRQFVHIHEQVLNPKGSKIVQQEMLMSKLLKSLRQQVELKHQKSSTVEN